MVREVLGLGYRAARRIVVAVIGATILLLGVALVVLPGPAVLVIPAGLAVLALEFAWARHWLERARDAARRSAESGLAAWNRATTRAEERPEA